MSGDGRPYAVWDGVLIPASRIAVMLRGCEQGTTDEVFNGPAHHYTRALIASVPVLTDAEEQAKPSVTLGERRAVLASTT